MVSLFDDIEHRGLITIESANLLHVYRFGRNQINLTNRNLLVMRRSRSHSRGEAARPSESIQVRRRSRRRPGTSLARIGRCPINFSIAGALLPIVAPGWVNKQQPRPAPELCQHCCRCASRRRSGTCPFTIHCPAKTGPALLPECGAPDG